MIEVQVAPQLAVTMSFRLPGAEADVIREAAKAENVTLSAWIRNAAGAPAAEPDVSRVADLARALEVAGLEVRPRRAAG